MFNLLLQTEAEYPQITVPQRMVDRLQKQKTKQALAEVSKQRKISYRSQLVISGKRPEFNHHKGQPFNEFDVKNLSSHGWKHYKSKGDYFTIRSHGRVGCRLMAKSVTNQREITLLSGVMTG